MVAEHDIGVLIVIITIEDHWCFSRQEQTNVYKYLLIILIKSKKYEIRSIAYIHAFFIVRMDWTYDRHNDKRVQERQITIIKPISMTKTNTRRTQFITGGFLVQKPLPKPDNTKKIETDLNTLAFLLFVSLKQNELILANISKTFKNKEIKYFKDVSGCIEDVKIAKDTLKSIYDYLCTIGDEQRVSNILDEMLREVTPLIDLSRSSTYEDICHELSAESEKDKTSALVLTFSTMARRVMYLAVRHAETTIERWHKDYPVIDEIFDPAKIETAFRRLDRCNIFLHERINTTGKELTLSARVMQIHRSLVASLLDKELYISACRTLNIAE